MRIYIKTMTGRTITCDVESNDKVQDVKHEIQDQMGIPLNNKD